MIEKIKLGDVVDAGYCVSGARKWFAHKGLSFRDFCRNGMTEEELGASDDEIVRRIFAKKRERDGKVT